MNALKRVCVCVCCLHRSDHRPQKSSSGSTAETKKGKFLCFNNAHSHSDIKQIIQAERGSQTFAPTDQPV